MTNTTDLIREAIEALDGQCFGWCYKNGLPCPACSTVTKLQAALPLIEQRDKVVETGKAWLDDLEEVVDIGPSVSARTTRTDAHIDALQTLKALEE